MLARPLKVEVVFGQLLVQAALFKEVIDDAALGQVGFRHFDRCFGIIRVFRDEVVFDPDAFKKRLGKAEVPEPVAKGGYMVWSANLPVPEGDEMPEDAPSRFRIGELMQVSTYADWQAVSRNHAQHYGTAGKVTPGGDLAGRIAGIASESDDPLTRAAMALRLVQDDISYLMNGMSGGNYIPQAPEETWEKRFGDCKAKTLLLLTMLRELGIEAEPVLVRSQGGDALPSLSPMPGNFDHVIVRAVIGCGSSRMRAIG